MKQALIFKAIFVVSAKLLCMSMAAFHEVEYNHISFEVFMTILLLHDLRCHYCASV